MDEWQFPDSQGEVPVVQGPPDLFGRGLSQTDLENWRFYTENYGEAAYMAYMMEYLMERNEGAWIEYQKGSTPGKVRAIVPLQWDTRYPHGSVIEVLDVGSHKVKPLRTASISEISPQPFGNLREYRHMEDLEVLNVMYPPKQNAQDF